MEKDLYCILDVLTACAFRWSRDGSSQMFIWINIKRELCDVKSGVDSASCRTTSNPFPPSNPLRDNGSIRGHVDDGIPWCVALNFQGQVEIPVLMILPWGHPCGPL